MMSAGTAYGQQVLFYNHYYINPFLYNPSYIAPNGYTEAYLNFRKQWTNIPGAPTTYTANLHLPMSYKTGLGVTLLQDQAGSFITTKGLVSFAYQIYLGEKITDIHKISFGLSAGVSNSRLDANDADDIQDPVYANNATYSMDGQFGLHYQYNNFKIGFALPTIFENRVVSEVSFNKEGNTQLDNMIGSISYDFKLSPRVSLEPMFTYRTFENLDPQFEGLASLKLSNVGWIGGAYRQDYGAVGFFGLNIKEKFKLGYAYEFATEQTDKIGNGTHEVQVILRLGKKHFGRPQAAHKAAEQPSVAHHQTPPAETRPATHIIDPVEDEPEEPTQEVSEPSAQPVTQPEHNVDNAPAERETPAVSQPVVQEPLKTVTQPVQKLPAEEQKVKTLEGGNLQPGHYVVVGAFANETNAKNYQRTLKRSGYPAHVAFHPGKGYFIVHMDTVDSLQDARQLRDKYRQMSRYSFRDTWILTIE